jgi:hypothetical protein
MTHTMESTANRQPGRDLLFGLVFSILATLVTLAAGELIIRVVSSRRLIYNIEMVKYAKELKMRDPKGEVSHVHRPSSHAKLMGVDVSLNALGDRGPELAITPDSLRKRVLVLGSSITMGWGVPFPQTFTATTERLLNERHPFGPRYSFEFVNGGIGNYNTVFQHALFERQFPVVKPDMVVLHYFVSDVQPRTMGRDSFILKHSYLAAFLFDRWSQIKLRFGGEYTDLFTFYDKLYADDSPAWAQTRQLVQSMHDDAARAGVPFVIVLTPDIHDLSPGTPFKQLYDKLETTFKGMGIETINSFDALQKEFGGDVSALWIQPDDPHPNAKGHALMADVLYQFVTERDPLGLKGGSQPTK